jgi:hypothetical protein
MFIVFRAIKFITKKVMGCQIRFTMAIEQYGHIIMNTKLIKESLMKISQNKFSTI